MSLHRTLVRPAVRSAAESAVYPITGAGRGPLITSIALMGDSISGGVSGATTTVNRANGGHVWPALALTGAGIELVRATAGTNFATGGYTAEDVNDTWLPQLISAAPDCCVVLSGANSLDDARVVSSDLDVAAAWLWDELVITLEGLRDNGIQAIIGTLTPDNYPTDTNYPPAGGSYHPDFRTIRKKVNDLIRANAPGYGAKVWDSALVYSTSPGDDTALADSDYLADEIHPNYLGSWALGDSLATVIRNNFSLPSDFTFPGSADSSWVTPNPYMTGSVSGLATGWSIINGSGLTINQSKVAPDDYQRLECTDGPDPGTNTSFYINGYGQVTDTTFDNRVYQAVAELEFSESDFEYWNIELRITCTVIEAGTFRYSYVPLQTASGTVVKSLALPPYPRNGRVTLISAPITQPAGTSTQRRRITASLYFWGRGTVDIKTLGCIDVTP